MKLKDQSKIKREKESSNRDSFIFAKITRYIMKGGERFMDKLKVLKIVGTVLSVVGAGVSLGMSAISDKRTDIELDNKVAEKVAEAIADLNKES